MGKVPAGPSPKFTLSTRLTGRFIGCTREEGVGGTWMGPKEGNTSKTMINGRRRGERRQKGKNWREKGGFLGK